MKLLKRQSPCKYNTVTPNFSDTTFKQVDYGYAFVI